MATRTGPPLCKNGMATPSYEFGGHLPKSPKAFEYYILAKGITKRGFLLHCAGIEEQELFEALQDPGAASGKNNRSDEYEIAMRTAFQHVIK